MAIGIECAGEEVAAVDDATGRDAVVDGRKETPAERADRNVTELLQQLRVVQTGVRIHVLSGVATRVARRDIFVG